MAALRVKFVDLVKPRPPRRGHVDLAADDGLDALPLAGPVEIDHPVHDAVVGDCHGGLAQLFDALCQAVDAAEAVEEAVLGVDVEVGK